MPICNAAGSQYDKQDEYQYAVVGETAEYVRAGRGNACGSCHIESAEQNAEQMFLKFGEDMYFLAHKEPLD